MSSTLGDLLREVAEPGPNRNSFHSTAHFPSGIARTRARGRMEDKIRSRIPVSASTSCASYPPATVVDSRPHLARVRARVAGVEVLASRPRAISIRPIRG